MINVQVLASGSKGNCTLLTCGSSKILLDAGINFGRLQRALNFENPTAALITHEHSDHANKSTINELLKRGVEVYMNEWTAQALNLEPRHNLKTQIAALFDISNAEKGEGLIVAKTLYAVHDAAKTINFMVDQRGTQWQEKVLYLTDTGQIPQRLLESQCAGYPLFRKIVIEANHSEPVLLAADIDEHQKQRILNNHLSIEKTAKYISGLERNFLEEVHLIHISRRHGNGEQFRQIIQEIVGDNVKVFAY